MYENISVIGNILLSNENNYLDKSVYELKIFDSKKISTDHMKHQFGENWEAIDIEVNIIFSICAPSLLK